MVSEQIAKFCVGALFGWCWEKLYAPHLQGSIRGVPIRPIYGFGAALSTDNLADNMLISIAAEKLGNANTKHWKYDVADPLVLDEDIDPRNSVAFGIAMTQFSRAWQFLKEH